MPMDRQRFDAELNDGQQTKRYFSLGQNLDPSTNSLVRAASSVIDAKHIVDVLRPIEANSNIHRVVEQGRRPIGIDQGAVRLETDSYLNVVERLQRARESILAVRLIVRLRGIAAGQVALMQRARESVLAVRLISGSALSRPGNAPLLALWRHRCCEFDRAAASRDDRQSLPQVSARWHLDYAFDRAAPRSAFEPVLASLPSIPPPI